MIRTLLDVAISPIEKFSYEVRDSNLPIILVVAGILAIAALTYFFIRYRDDKNDTENKED